MAPRMQTDYHSAEEINRYSLRTLKRGENNVSQRRHIDASIINRKEDFLHCLGLQMKRFPCQYPTLHGVQPNIKDRSHSNGLKLRNCSVVVLGATCNICGKCFKCETDVNVHVAKKHSCAETVSTVRVYGQEDGEMSGTLSKSSKYGIVTKKNSATKLQSKLRLILRIGDEIVTETTVKRKHLKLNKTISMATQTELVDAAKLITKNNACKGDVPGIDHTVFDNSPCQCCTATMRVVNGTNQYIAGNFVENNPTKSEEVARCNEVCRNDRLASTCETSILPPNLMPFKTTEVDVEENNLISQIDNRVSFAHKSNNFAESVAFVKPMLATQKRCDDTRYTESVKLTSNTTPQIVDSVTVTFQSHPKDNNGNEKLRGCYTEKLLQTHDGINTVQLVMPVILPIIVPNQISSTTAASQRPTAAMSEQHSKKCFVEKQNTDDDVQEVLRIVRGHDNVAREINHESPNRFEQEMLATDAIKDMLRMEQRGLHLLERKGVEQTKKRKRASVVNRDIRNGVVEEATRKNMKTVSPENNVVKAMSNERNISKESFARVQKSSHDKISISENAKENVLTCNGNISIPSETLLQHYGINYYIDVCEINNNTEAAVQDPVSCLFIPRSAGIETMSNRPTVIDLVNDNDE